MLHSSRKTVMWPIVSLVSETEANGTNLEDLQVPVSKIKE
jgi:hypothetical protein